MRVLTKRNALIGWVALIVGRQVAKRKLRRFSPRRRALLR